jgi:uncharacterized protein YqgQ
MIDLDDIVDGEFIIPKYSYFQKRVISRLKKKFTFELIKNLYHKYEGLIHWLSNFGYLEIFVECLENNIEKKLLSLSIHKYDIQNWKKNYGRILWIGEYEYKICFLIWLKYEIRDLETKKLIKGDIKNETKSY